MQKIDKLLAESKIEDIREKLASVSLIKDERLDELREEFTKLQDDISAGDWGRIGVLAGMLWFKLDTLVNHLSNMNSTLHAIERNTGKIK